MGKLSLMALAAVLAIAPSKMNAQLEQSFQRVSQAEREKRALELREQSPYFSRIKGLTPKAKNAVKGRKFNSRLSQYAPFAPSEPVKSVALNSKSEIWAILYSFKDMSAIEQRAMVSFLPGSTSYETVHSMPYNINAGSALVNGQFYGGYFSQSSWYASSYLYQIDTNSWTAVQNKVSLPDFSLVAMETAQASDGTVYGEFLTAAGDTIEWGVVDYATKSRTTIAKAKHTMVALGITKGGVLYGVATDGNLYRVDKATGSETLVGSTGVQVSDADGYYYQSGEIDPRDDTFYWIATDVTGTSTLMTVDLTSGKATPVYTFSNEEKFTSMTIIAAKADDNAPAEVSDLDVNFENGSTTGTVSFVAPTENFAGETLTGELNYFVTVDNEVLAQGTTTAGASESVTVTSKEGMQQFVVTTSNAAGTSPAMKKSVWVGYDVPNPATDVVLSVDKSTGKVDLNWTAPTAGQHNAYLGDLKYDVIRYTKEDTTVVAKDLDATAFSETLEMGKLKTYIYGVVAKNAAKQSAVALSNGMMLGNAYDVPYLEPFLTPEVMDFFTVVDANNDDNTWNYNVYSNKVYYRYGKNAADDWLISPPIKLKKGQIYEISLLAKNGLKSYSENFEMKMGQGSSVSDMTTEVIPATEVTTGQFDKYGNDNIMVSEDGEYNLGIHVTSPANHYWFYIDSLQVVEGPSASAPDSVVNYQIVPDAKGELKAQISLVAPSNNMLGEPLTDNLTKIDVYRNGTLVKTFENVAPAAALSFEDNTITKNGDNTYRFIASNSFGEGRKIEYTKYIGVDIAQPVENVKVADNQNTVTISWDKVSEEGIYGGYVNPDKMTYRVYSTVVSDDEIFKGQVLGETSTTSFDVTENTDEGEQGLKYWAIEAANAAGSHDFSIAELFTGKPYELPFRESVTGGDPSHFWYYFYTSINVGLYYSDKDASDADGGCFKLRTTDNFDIGELNSGKIALAGVANPKLFFDVKSTSTESPLTVVVVSPSGQTDSVKTFVPGKEFGTYTVDLKKYANERFIRLQFYCEFDEAGEFTFDNINVVDGVEKDLAVSIHTPAEVVAGKSADIDVKVRNWAATEATGYTLKLYAGDEVVYEETKNDVITPMGVKEYAIPYNPSIFSKTEYVTLKAEVVFDGDADEKNNAASDYTHVVEPKAAAPESLTGAQNEEGTVDLTWVAPAGGAQEVTEDFEDYEDESVSGWGDWTLVDNDRVDTQGFLGDYVAAHEGEQFAYMIFNPEKQGFNVSEAGNESVTPHSGKQFAMAIYGYVDYEETDQDNWLISPEVPGIAQTISFYAKSMNTKYGQETYEVLYSTTDKSLSSFKSVTKGSVPASWTKVTADLPEGTKYFAIRNTTSGDAAFVFELDDITYQIAGGQSAGYNVYVDGELVESLEGGVTEYTVESELEDGDHVFGVTATYADGSESKPVTTTLTTTGVTTIKFDGKHFYDVFSVDGKLVRRNTNNVNGLKGVYVVDGKKVVLK